MSSKAKGAKTNRTDGEQKGERRNHYTTVKMAPCKVCGRESTGYHFGAITCEACKAFYRRALGKDSYSSYKCTRGGQCGSVFPGKITNCSACRIKRCLEIGMSKGGVRRGRYSIELRTKSILEAKREQSQRDLLLSASSSMAKPKSTVKGQAGTDNIVDGALRSSTVDQCASNLGGHDTTGQSRVGDMHKTDSPGVNTDPHYRRGVNSDIDSPDTLYLNEVDDNETRHNSTHGILNQQQENGPCASNSAYETRHICVQDSGNIISGTSRLEDNAVNNVHDSRLIFTGNLQFPDRQIECNNTSVNKFYVSNESCSNTSIPNNIHHPCVNEPQSVNSTPCPPQKHLPDIRIDHTASAGSNIPHLDVLEMTPPPVCPKLTAEEEYIESVIRQLVSLQGMLYPNHKVTDNIVSVQKRIEEEHKKREEAYMFMFGSTNVVSASEFKEVMSEVNIELDDRLVAFREKARATEKDIALYITSSRFIPGFDKLEKDDVSKLLKASYSEFWLFSNCAAFNEKTGVSGGTDGVINAHKKVVSLFFPAEFIESVFKFSTSLKKLDLTVEEIAIIRVVLLTFTDRCSLGRPDKVEQLQELFIKCLRYHLSKTTTNASARFCQIMERIAAARSITHLNSSVNRQFLKEWGFIMKDFNLWLEIMSFSCGL